MDALAIAAEYLPQHDQAALQHVLWSYTGFPAFLPHGEMTLREQLSAYRAASQAGLEICFGCGQAHSHTQLDRRGVCQPCAAKLRALQAA